MSEMTTSTSESIKVYELAREIGIDSISLLDELKKLNINVKSHMSSLTELEVQAARNVLVKATKSSKSATSKVASKSVATKAPTKAKTTKSAATAPSAPPPKRRAPMTGTSPAQATLVANAVIPDRAGDASKDKDPASSVIRRRVRADGATETVTSTRVTSTVAAEEEAAANLARQTRAAAELETTEEVIDAAPAIEAEEAVIPQEAVVAEPVELVSAPTEEVPSEEAEPVELAATAEVAGSIAPESVQAAQEHTESVAPAETPTVAETAPAAAATTPPRLRKRVLTFTEATPPPSRVKKDELVSTKTESLSTEGIEQTTTTTTTLSRSSAGTTQTTTVVRKTITVAPAAAAVGARTGAINRRGVLTIVEAKAPPMRPMFKPTDVAGAKDGRPAPLVRPLRPGEVPGGPRIRTGREAEILAEEEAKKKPGGVRENRPEDANFADYRKKELIFLPKRKRIPVGKQLQKTQITKAAAHKRVVEMGDNITVQDLANQLGVKGAEVVRKLMTSGKMVSMHQSVDFDTASMIAAEYQHEVKNVAFKESEVIAAETESTEGLLHRPPVVTIMGHVDHGKTTLLDAIRGANVVAGEAGGITQHIGAYTVSKDGKLITFIDTPGHEAFTSMRARGAQVTDIVVLVVAADDGVMPQTREAISHAKAAGVPIVVAVNKMDKPGAQPDRIKQALAELELLAEDWGGDTMFIPVSALKKEGLDQLLEAILLNAEVLDLKADPTLKAHGVVLEARLDRGRGPVVTLLIDRGTLRVGEPVVVGTTSGRVRAMTNHLGKAVTEVTPGMAAEILGLDRVPNPGDAFDATVTEADAIQVAEHRAHAKQTVAKTDKVRLEDFFAKMQSKDLKELKIVLKADVYGSVEAVRDSLLKLSNAQVKVNIIHIGVGGITESDVLLASASNAIILGFGVRPESKAMFTANAEQVEIKTYSIIYELIDDVKAAMTGLLDKKKVEKFLGRAEVRQAFVIPKAGTIAGSSVIDGKITRNASVRLLRNSRIIYEGKLISLRRFKDDAREVATGYECGIGLENYNDVKPGDVIEAYEIELITPELQFTN